MIKALKTLSLLTLFVFITFNIRADNFGGNFNDFGPNQAFQLWVSDPSGYFGTTASPPTVQSALMELGASASIVSSGGHTIQDEGGSLTQRTKLNFVGAGVTVTDGGAGTDDTIVTITAGSSGSGTPGGSNMQVQYNSGGTFGGSTNLTFQSTGAVLTATGSIVAGGIGGVSQYSVGSGVGTLGFNDGPLNYQAEVPGFGALMQLVPGTGVFNMMTGSNVAAGTSHAHTTALSWNSAGIVTIPNLASINSDGGAINSNGSGDLTISGKINTGPATTSVLSIGGNYYLPFAGGSTGQVITLQTNGSSLWQTPSISTSGATSSSGSVMAVFDGGGSAIATGSVAWARLSSNCTFTEWAVTSYATCPTLIVNILKSTYDTYDPNFATLINGSESPTLTSQRKNRDTFLSTWTTAANANDYIYFKIINADTATYAVVTIGYTK